MSAPGDDDIRGAIQAKYEQAALRVRQGQPAVHGAAPAAVDPSSDPIGADLYTDDQISGLPPSAFLSSLGCGNPTALFRLSPGEVVLDLGSGGGADVLLAAGQVGPAGKVYGLDMTEEMVVLARENQRKAGVTNVELVRGFLESIPLPDSSVDVIISNAAINLSTDKDSVFREAFRVLRPGGRLAVSDVTTKGEMPPAVRDSVAMWLGCMGGVLSEDDYATKLASAGFQEISVEPQRLYDVAEPAREHLKSAGLEAEARAAGIDKKFRSAFIRAVKPQGA